MSVTLLTAFAAGTLALLSPCSALLLPSFFAYAFHDRWTQLGRTAVFTVGLAAVLVPLGMGASAASTLVYGHREAVIAAAGWTLIALGVLYALGRGFAFPFAERLRDRLGPLTRGSGLPSTFLLGAVYGLAGFCSGPILGAILTVAATERSPVHGGLLLATYALGMAVPLFVMAVVWDRFDLGRRRWLRGRAVALGPLQLHSTSLLTGALFVVLGVVFLRTDGTVGLGGALGLGDTTDAEAGAQSWLSDALGGVPGWVLPAAVGLVAAVVAWRRSRPHPAAATTGPGSPLTAPDA